jgi:hypothetical protein
MLLKCFEIGNLSNVPEFSNTSNTSTHSCTIYSHYEHQSSVFVTSVLKTLQISGVKFRIVWPYIVIYSLWIKPTDALNSNFIGNTTLHDSGSLSTNHQEFLAVHRLWYILCSCDEQFATPGIRRSSQLHKMYQSRCTAKNSWWWAERLPGTCRVVVPITLGFSASVGFIHKDSGCKSTRPSYDYLPSLFNHLTPNGHFSGRTAPLTYRCCIFFYLFNRYMYWIF